MEGLLKKLGWSGIFLSIVLSGFSLFTLIMDLHSLGLPADVWLTIGIAIFFISVIILVLSMRRDMENRIKNIINSNTGIQTIERKQNTSVAKLELKPINLSATYNFEYQEYNVSNSKDFYNNIAACYDQRNSPELLETHREVIKLISSHLINRNTFKVLDLGGGTGKLIAHHFFESNLITWVYVDSSPAMVEQFNNNLRHTNLKLDINIKDIREISSLYPAKIPAKTCDVILLSFLLTSMPEITNFEELLPFLKDDGIFIIADIDPVYTILHPHYIVNVGNRSHALRANPVNPSELDKNMMSCGLKQRAVKTIKEGNANYSFVHVFGR